MLHTKSLTPKVLTAVVVSLGLAACSDSTGGFVPIPTTEVSGNVGIFGTEALAEIIALDEYVLVAFTSEDTNDTTAVLTDNLGFYTVDLIPGTYDVVAARPGYDDVLENGFVVDTGPALVLDFALAALADNVYIGSMKCGVCHDATYQTFRETGHPYKLNKVNGAAPIYPFTDLNGVELMIGDDDLAVGDPKPGTDNTLGTPAGWDDITYVIGGFNWKARFVDADGYIVTGSSVQYNYATDAMSAYHDNETDKPFNCGNCHTTGWQHQDLAVNDNRQDGLPGMDGTFAEQGIGCEACHGAGSTHAQTMLMSDIVKIAPARSTADFQDGAFAYGQAVACKDCHTRDGERDYPTFISAFDTARTDAFMPVMDGGGRIAASGGLVKHHEQFDEALGIDPDTLDSTRSAAFMSMHGDCMTCHDTHKAAVWRDEPGIDPGVDPTNANCLSCHSAAQYDTANNLRGSMVSLDCADCHMPKTAKSATSRTQPNGVLEGDVTSHVFGIDIYGPQFTVDNKFSYPYLSYDFACRNCHGDEVFDIPTPPANFNYHPDSGNN